MPLNAFITTTKALADDTKAALAAEFTKIHSSITGAPTSFVQVISQELPATNVLHLCEHRRDPSAVRGRGWPGHARAGCRERLARRNNELIGTQSLSAGSSLGQSTITRGSK